MTRLILYSLLLLLISTSDSEASGRRRTGAAASAINTLNEALYDDMMMRRQASYQAELNQQAAALELIVALINSGQLRVAQSGEQPDFFLGQLPMKWADASVSEPALPSSQRFCPTGGEVFPSTIRYCPNHGVELRAYQP